MLYQCVGSLHRVRVISQSCVQVAKASSAPTPGFEPGGPQTAVRLASFQELMRLRGFVCSRRGHAARVIRRRLLRTGAAGCLQENPVQVAKALQLSALPLSYRAAENAVTNGAGRTRTFNLSLMRVCL